MLLTRPHAWPPLAAAIGLALLIRHHSEGVARDALPEVAPAGITPARRAQRQRRRAGVADRAAIKVRAAGSHRAARRAHRRRRDALLRARAHQALHAASVDGARAAGGGARRAHAAVAARLLAVRAHALPAGSAPLAVQPVAWLDLTGSREHVRQQVGAARVVCVARAGGHAGGRLVAVGNLEIAHAAQLHPRHAGVVVAVEDLKRVRGAAPQPAAQRGRVLAARLLGRWGARVNAGISSRAAAGPRRRAAARRPRNRPRRCPPRHHSGPRRFRTPPPPRRPPPPPTTKPGSIACTSPVRPWTQKRYRPGKFFLKCFRAPELDKLGRHAQTCTRMTTWTLSRSALLVVCSMASACANGSSPPPPASRRRP